MPGKKNLLTTVPQRGDLKKWADVERIFLDCDGEEDFWTFSCRYFPKDSGPGACCFMVHSGFVRGYFTILEYSDKPVYRYGESQTEAEEILSNKVKLAVWRPIPPQPMTGFQGWRYTDLQP